MKIKWLLFLVSLTPVAVSQASVITADNMVIGLSILFIAGMTRLMTSKKNEIHPYILYIVLATALLLPLVKINYILLSAGVLLIPDRLFTNRLRGCLFKFGGLLVSGISGLVWWRIMSLGSANVPISQRPDGLVLDPGAQLLWVLQHPINFLIICMKSIWINGDSYFHQTFTLIHWNFVDLPSFFAITLLLLSILALFYAKDELMPKRKQFVWFGLFGIAGVFSIFLALYVSFNPTGYGRIDGVQGRYFIPFLVPILILVASSIPVRVKIKDKWVLYALPGIACISLLASIAYYYIVTYL